MIALVLGRRGYGKTTYIKKALIPASGRVLIFDTLGEYSDVARPSYTVVDFLSSVERHQGGYFRLSLVPLDAGDDPSIAFDLFVRTLWALGDCTGVVDEIDAVSSPTSVPGSLARSIRYGRHRSVSLVAASRRAAEVPRLLTSQADLIVSFNQSEPNDLDYLKRYVGAEFAASVSQLPPYEFRSWTPGQKSGLDKETEPGENSS